MDYLYWNHQIMRVRGHYEVYDTFTGKFVCSGDTESEAFKELVEILKEKYIEYYEEADKIA